MHTSVCMFLCAYVYRFICLYVYIFKCLSVYMFRDSYVGNSFHLGSGNLLRHHSGCQVLLSKPLAAPLARTTSIVLLGTLFTASHTPRMYVGIERACDFVAHENRRKMLGPKSVGCTKPDSQVTHRHVHLAWNTHKSKQAGTTCHTTDL